MKKTDGNEKFKHMLIHDHDCLTALKYESNQSYQCFSKPLQMESWKYLAKHLEMDT